MGTPCLPQTARQRSPPAGNWSAYTEASFRANGVLWPQVSGSSNRPRSTWAWLRRRHTVITAATGIEPGSMIRSYAPCHRERFAGKSVNLEGDRNAMTTPPCGRSRNHGIDPQSGDDPMRWLRFSIAGVMAFILYAAIGLAAYANTDAFWY